MRRTVEETNGFTAWVAGTGHEVGGFVNGSPVNETIMDLHNNAVGRDAGAKDQHVNIRDLNILPSDGSQYLSVPAGP